MKHTTFANDIQYFRKEKNLSQQALADLIDVERSELSRMENGHYLPSKKLLEKLSEVLECRISELYPLNVQDVILKHRL